MRPCPGTRIGAPCGLPSWQTLLVRAGWVISAITASRTTISCSSAVRECHATTHPGRALRIHVDGPVKGSPVSSADARHATSRSGANGTDPKGFTVLVIASSATTPPPVTHPRAAAARNVLFIVVLLLAARGPRPADKGRAVSH